MKKAQSNLKPVQTVEEARARGRRGGLASGEARRKKKALKDRLKLLLEIVSESGKEAADEIALALIDQAKTGNVKAFEVIRDTIGEKPVDKVATTDTEGNDMPTSFTLEFAPVRSQQEK